MKKSNNSIKSQKYSALVTEQNNPRTLNLDRISLKEVLIKINYEDSLISKAVKKAIPQIEKTAKILSKTHLSGGRIFLWEREPAAVWEFWKQPNLPPPSAWSLKNFTPIMAGGKYAVFLSKEGAEDFFKNGYNEIFKK